MSNSIDNNNNKQAAWITPDKLRAVIAFGERLRAEGKFICQLCERKKGLHLEAVANGEICKRCAGAHR